MTITSTLVSISYAGDGASTVFAVPFPFFGPDELGVYAIVAGVSTTLVRGVAYNVTGGNDATGTVAAIIAPASGTTWAIRRRTARTQQVDYIDFDPFPASTHEMGMDRLTAQSQETDESINRSVRAPIGEAALAAMPALALRANKALAFDSVGQPIVLPVFPVITISTPTVTPEQFGAVGNGVTDDTVAINLAELTLSAAGGGVLNWGPKTYLTTGLTKRSNVIWQGCGKGVTTIKLKSGTATGAVVAGLNAYALFGTNVLTGLVNWALRDLTIDGNRTGGCTSDGLGVYGWVFDINNVEIKSCNGRGWRNEYGQPGIEAHQNVQSQAANMLIWDNQTDGIYYGGPNDSLFDNINVYWNLRYGIWLYGLGTIKASDCHVWSDAIGGRQHTIGWRLDSPINTLTACVGEGSTSHQCWIRSSSNTIVSGEWFYNQASPNTAIGFLIGDVAGLGGGIVAAGDNTIITRVDNCQGGALAFSSDTGHNRFDILGVNNTLASVGYSGANGATSRIRLHISNCNTNGTLNSEALAKGYAGLLTAGAGLTVLGLGGVAGGGAVAAGPANGGGAGFRLLVVPN